MIGDQPPYGVIIPAYNAARTIAETIGSILGQTVPPADVLVIDDGSTDDTVAVASALGSNVRVITQPNQGPGAATYHGVRESDEAILAFCDADDLWLKDKMARQLGVLAEAADCRAVFGHMQHMRDTDGELGRIQTGPTRTTMVVARTVFLKIGDVIDPPGGRGDLVDWLARAREAGCELNVVNDVLALRRIHPGSMSYGRNVEKDRGYLHVIRQAMLRKKRAQSGDGN